MNEHLDKKGGDQYSRSSRNSLDEGQVESYGHSDLDMKGLQPQGHIPHNWKSGRQWLRWLETSDTEGLKLSQLFLYNFDLKPVEKARRTWGWYNFVMMWLADAINVNTFQIAGSSIQSGLTWWEAWLGIWIGYGISACLITWASRVGAYYHISFPVSCRASFGVYGSLWPVINRVVMAIIWFSSQTWIGGECVQIMLKGIFDPRVGKRMGDKKNLSGTSVFEFVSFFIAWVIHLPAMWFPPHQIRHLFTLKAIVAPFTIFGFLIWALVRNHGGGDLINHPKNDIKFDKSDPHDEGWYEGWAFVDAVMNAMANYATLVLNAPDFSRLSTKPSDSTWSQLITIPFGFGVTSLVGIIIASTAQSTYGKDITWAWDPLKVLDKWVNTGTAGCRGGGFLIALGLLICQLGTNVCANSLSAGTDMTSFLPKFMNIRRGAFLCAALALCICPWHFFSASSQFTTYLSAYAVFLSCISGVVLTDYTWLRHGKLDLKNLYNGSKSSPYMYKTSFGCNWRGFAAYLLALVPNMPGFVGQSLSVPVGAKYLYRLNYFVGFILSSLLYMLFCWISPPEGIPVEVQGRPFSKIWLEKNVDVEFFDEEVRDNGLDSGKLSQRSHESTRSINSSTETP